jgi:uncharacterized membrane protein
VYHLVTIRIGATAFRWGLVAMTAGWMLALLLATAIAALQRPGVTSYLFSTTVFLTGSLLCHQRPERSFHWWGAQVPVCARCFGIYAGTVLSAITIAVTSTTVNHMRHARAWVLTALTPNALTLVYEWATGDMPGNWVRAGSGVLLGVAVMLVIAEAGKWMSAEDHVMYT